MGSAWENRIVAHGERAARDFKPNPANWRGHPDRQRAALRDSLGELGWIQSVVVNRTTGNVVDGHARIEEALRVGPDTPVPFVEVELTPEQEKLALALLDPISAMAEANREQLDALLRDVATSSEPIQAMLAELAAPYIARPEGEESAGQSPWSRVKTGSGAPLFMCGEIQCHISEEAVSRLVAAIGDQSPAEFVEGMIRAHCCS